jgi:hypothetical protein
MYRKKEEKMGISDIFTGGKKAAVHNAAELLAQKIADGEFDVQTGMFSENNNAEIYDITSIDRLAEYLDGLRDTEKSGASSFADALLNTISIIRTPAFEEGAFSSTLDSIKKFLEKIPSSEKKIFQRQAAQIIIILISFMEAKYYYGRKKIKDAKKKMETACLLLADSVTALNEQILENNSAPSVSGIAVAIQELYGPFWSPKAGNNPLDDLFNKQPKQIEDEFYSFMIYVFSELSENKEIFGKSPMFRELVKEYKTELFNRQKPDDIESQILSLKKPALVNPLLIISLIIIIAGFIFFPIIAAAGIALLLISIIIFFSKKKKYQANLDELTRMYDEKCRPIKEFYDYLENYFN